MRIISGKFKGRILKVPNSKLIRPTTDRTKEALFNYLSNFIDFNGIVVCDLYAGSGSLGFEALSRGVLNVHFVEKNYIIYKTIHQNIININVEDECKIFKMSAIRFSNRLEHEKYNLIFADPPFFRDDIYQVVAALLKNNFLEDNGLIIVERSIQTKEKDIINFSMEPFKRIGDSLIYQFS